MLLTLRYFRMLHGFRILKYNIKTLLIFISLQSFQPKGFWLPVKILARVDIQQLAISQVKSNVIRHAGIVSFAAPEAAMDDVCNKAKAGQSVRLQIRGAGNVFPNHDVMTGGFGRLSRRPKPECSLESNHRLLHHNLWTMEPVESYGLSSRPIVVVPAPNFFVREDLLWQRPFQNSETWEGLTVTSKYTYLTINQLIIILIRHITSL